MTGTRRLDMADQPNGFQRRRGYQRSDRRPTMDAPPRRRSAEAGRPPPAIHPDTVENYENAKIHELAIDIEDRLAAPPADPKQGKDEPIEFSGSVGRPTGLNALRVFVAVSADGLTGARRELFRRLNEDELCDVVDLAGTDFSEELIDEIPAVNVLIVLISSSPSHSHRTAHSDHFSRLREQYELLEPRCTVLVYAQASQIRAASNDSSHATEEVVDHENFVARLQEFHSIRPFGSAAELSVKLSLDLAQLHHSGSKHLSAPSPLQIFGDDINQIRDAIDERNRTTRREIQLFLDFLGEKFRPLFSFDGDSLLRHSLFRESSERLAALIPEFTLTAEEGVILRTGVRHMIMRTQTAVRLLSAIPE
jgi:hypothetical protein